MGWDGFSPELTGAGRPAVQQTLSLLCKPLPEPLLRTVLSSPIWVLGLNPSYPAHPWSQGGTQSGLDSSSSRTPLLGALCGGAACQEGERRVRFLSGVWASGASQGWQPLSSEAREPFAMDELSGEERAQRRVCRREKSGRSPFPASPQVEGGREVADLGVRVSHGCSPHPHPASGRRAAADAALFSAFP